MIFYVGLMSFLFYNVQYFQIHTTSGKLELIHKTSIDEYPGAMAAFNGKLLVGVGKMLRLYDIGKYVFNLLSYFLNNFSKCLSIFTIFFFVDENYYENAKTDTFQT